MRDQETICLLNDAFPPILDGVSTTVVNYAGQLQRCGYDTMVVTPAHPKAEDGVFDFPVVRYPSVHIPGYEGYMAGVPFSPETVRRVTQANTVLLHSHCPIISNLFARSLRQIADAPIVFTYHTKFDVDLANITKSKALQEACKKMLVENISACDEIWVVSKGAGENLESLGYEGTWQVMRNGVDLPRGRLSRETIQAETGAAELPPGVPVYLYVGRMMWYKGIRLTLDALAELHAKGRDFRMVFIGTGFDEQEMRDCTEKNGIGEKCLFLGAVRERERLRAWYCRADLFLFPSTFDTNGLVVREAAACGLPSVLICGSCAAEDVTDGENGFLIEETPESFCALLERLQSNPEALHHVGKNAEETLYLSWEDAVKVAAQQYQVVIDRYKRGLYLSPRRPMEEIIKLQGEFMELLANLRKQ